VRAGDGRYYDLATTIGMAEPMCSRGIALADVDGDGDLDLAVANQWEPSYFFRNDAPHAGSFLGLHLWLPLDDLAPTSIRNGHQQPGGALLCAIGASVNVQLPDGRNLSAQVDGGTGHSGKRAPDLHFGLGKIANTSRLDVEIRWRSRNGNVRSQHLKLAPGWYSVLLGRDG
jgi:hypothetical protein